MRVLSAFVAGMALILATAGLVARYVPVTNHTTLVATVASPYLLLGAPVGVIVLTITRRWVLAGLATVLTVAAVVVHLPLFIGAQTHSGGVALRVMTANLYLGQAEATDVVATAVASADVLAVQELTKEQVAQFSAAGLEKAFPFHALDARDYASGGGVWSRYPIVNQQRIGGYVLAMVSVQIAVPGIPSDPTILVAHLPGPWPQPIDGWDNELKSMNGTLQSLSRSAGGGCAIVAGDFNSTLDMAPFRHLLDNGYRDASETAGAGFTLTYPANAQVPPFMGIDHILTSNCEATAVRTVRLPGSDHKGLSATIEVPK